MSDRTATELWRGMLDKDKLDSEDAVDYPGSTPPRNRPGGEKYEQRAEAKSGERSYEYETSDGLKTFYTIATIARIFGRKPVTIRSWEAKGVLPTPNYRSPKPVGHHLGSAPAGRRLYTQNQVDYLVALCERYNMLDHLNADWKGFQKAMAEYPTD